MCVGVLGAPGLEELHKLLAGGFIVPVAVAAEKLDQFFDRALLVAVAGLGDGKLEARFMVGGVGGKAGLKRGGVDGIGCAVGEVEGGVNARYIGIVSITYKKAWSHYDQAYLAISNLSCKKRSLCHIRHTPIPHISYLLPTNLLQAACCC